MKHRKSIFDGKERMKISIQIGDSTFESAPTEMNFSNDNFIIIHKRESIVSKIKTSRMLILLLIRSF
jgi:hypothetical protein